MNPAVDETDYRHIGDFRAFQPVAHANHVNLRTAACLATAPLDSLTDVELHLMFASVCALMGGFPAPARTSLPLPQLAADQRDSYLMNWSCV